VVEQRDEPPALLADLDREHGAHEPPPAEAVPAPHHLEAVRLGPLEALDLEADLAPPGHQLDSPS
jgi:hypothetical protein